MPIALHSFSSSQQTVHSSLLLQFLLNDFIKVQHLLEDWDTHQGIDSLLSSLSTAFQKTSEQQLPWIPKTSLLTSLESYAFQLTEGPSKTLFEKLHRCFCLANTASYEYLSTLDPFSKNKASDLLIYRMKIQQAMKKASKLIPKVIEHFKDDENMILFLINHNSELEKIYGVGFLKKWMDAIYSEGLSHARQFVLIRYAQRGFDNLLPLIEAKFSKLRTLT